ncbi:MAG: hypothetical protein HY962_02630 [Ignavibacteriae bacterium]|nr:hypothetical protein [Ignavibacteriota bacterium]
MKTRRSLSALVLVFIAPIWTSAQDIDLRALSDAEFLQRLAEYRSGRAPGNTLQQRIVPGCGFGWTIETARRAETMSPADRATMRRLLAPATYDMSLLSPSGRFRIHYDTSGTHMAAMIDATETPIRGTSRAYAEAVAAFFDHTYVVEVLQRGYQAPPFEAGQNTYNIFLRNVGSDYGNTQWVDRIPSTTVQPIFTSFIEIDNDFAGGYFSKGLEGAKVTAAHEFHHMIQMGSYGLLLDDRYIHELTSVYYEDEVYPDVNDYYQYLGGSSGLFTFPERSIHAWGAYGYPLVLLPKMLERRHDTTLMRRTWEGIRSRHPYFALDDALRASTDPSDLSIEYCAFARWNFYTGYRAADAAPSERYDEAASYPTVKIASTIAVTNGSATLSGAVSPYATVYMRAAMDADTAAFSVSQVNLTAAVQAATGGGGAPVQFTIDIRTSGYGAEYLPVGNGWGYRFLPASPGMLCLNVYSKGAIPDRKVYFSPNPYDPAGDGIARVSVPNSVPQTRGTLAIFTGSMNRIALLEDAAILGDPTFGRYIAWNGRDDAGENAASGIYVFVLNVGGTMHSGKFVIVRR